MKKIKDYTKTPISRKSTYYKFAKLFFKTNGITCRFRSGGYFGGGWAIPKKSQVQVNMTWDSPRRSVSVSGFLTTVFHEAQHIFNYRNNKYKVFHEFGNIKELSKDDFRTFLRTAYKAEVYTDCKARKLMALYFPEVPYAGSYEAQGVSKFRRNTLEPIKEHYYKRIEQSSTKLIAKYEE